MSDIIIRPATVLDAKSLPDVEKFAIKSFRRLVDLGWIADAGVLSEEQHLDYIAKGHSWVAQNANGELTGFIVGDPMGESFYIEELCVVSKHQGKGIGARLLNTCMQWAYQQGYKAITLTTFEEVPWNKPWYAHLGFEKIPTRHITPELKRKLVFDDQTNTIKLKQFSRCAMQKMLS